MKKRRAFSLIELIVSLGILALLATFSLVNLRGALSAANASSLARVVAEQLRLARQSALATQEPVALLVPSQGKSASQALYLATGLSTAHVSKVVLLGGDFPESVLYGGLVWPSTSSFSIFPSLPGQRSAAFQAAPWLANTLLSDYALIFGADGGVTSNGMPFFQGAYHLIAAAGGACSSTATPASATSTVTNLSYFEPTALGRPWTITLTPAGQISLSAGLPGLTGSVRTDANLPVSDVAPPPTSDSLPALAPTITNCTLLPLPAPDLPAGFNATLAPGQRLTLAVNATESSGRDLYIRWTSTPGPSNSGTAPGNFSLPGQQRMAWDSVNRLWTSSWDWLTPLSAQPGDTFSFQCSLGDGVNATTEASPGQKVAVLSGGDRIYLDDGYNVYKANLDGACFTPLISQVDFATAMSVSADGALLVRDCWSGAGYSGNYTIYSGSSATPLMTVNPPNFDATHGIAISPLGNKVAYYTSTVPYDGLNREPYQLTISNLDGSSPTTVATVPLWPNGGGPIQLIAWSRDQTQIGWVGDYLGGSRIGTANVTGLPNLTSTPTLLIGTNSLTWAPDGSALYCTIDSLGGGLYKCFPGSFNPTSLLTLNSANQCGGLALDPTGTTFFYGTGFLGVYSFPSSFTSATCIVGTNLDIGGCIGAASH